MFKTLLFRLGMMPRLVFLLVVLALGMAHPTRASHLLGGEMSYQYLDANGPASAPFRYQITVTSYYNPNGQVGLNNASVTSVNVGIFNRTTGARITTVSVPRQTPVGAVVQPRLPSGCTVQGPTQPFRLFKYVYIASLPATIDGYYAVCTQSARNVGLENVSNPATTNGGNLPMTLYVSMAPPLIYNRSPVFSDTAVAIICTTDTTVLLNNAFDADGDRLIYSFGTPYGALSNANSFPPLPNLVPYNAGYNTANPLGTGPGNFALINANTGTARYGVTKKGLYIIAVDVSEYRTINGREVLIGTTRRDLQLVASDCPPTVAPVLPPVASTPRTYTIEEGQTLSIPLTATQADGHPLTLTLNSVLLDGPAGFNATFNGSSGTVVPGNPTGTANTTGTGQVTGTFIYNSACGDARANPYDVALTVRDNGCAGKTVADVLRITVTRPAGPTAISGDAVVCNLGTVSTYRATGGTAPGVRWRVVGGTFVGTNTGVAVQVRWGTAGTGTVVAKGMSQYGCLTDSISQMVAVAPAGTLIIGGGLTVCQGASTTLTVAGGTAPYTLVGGGTTQSGTGPFSITPTQTITYTITSSATALGCTSTQQVTVVVVPLPGAAVGLPTRATCSGVPLILGVTAVAGNTYSWTPATGLSSATVANPTLTLTNATNAPLTTSYTLTETTPTGGCVATNTVAVTVNPLPMALPGAAVALCSGNSAQLGAAPVGGLAYSWSPATGLSNPTAANPTVTLTNTTGAPVATTYTLTVSAVSAGCTAIGTVAVTVNPLPTAAPGPAVAFCSGGSAQLGSAPIAGTTYSWNPTTYLSSSTIANPIVTLTNSTNAPITITYTLTATTPTGCTATTPVAVTVNPAATAAAGSAQAVCDKSTITLGMAAQPGYSYRWTPATGLSSSTIAQPVLTAANLTGVPFIQKYMVLATTAQGCSARDSVLITLNPRPVADSIAGPQSVCPTVTGIGYSIKNSHSTAYQWTVTGAMGFTGQGTASITVNWGPAGTGAVRATAANAQGCVSDAFTLPVVINQVLQTVKPTGPVSVCQADGPYAYSTPAISGSSFAWQLFGTATGTLVSTSNTTSVRFAQAGLAKLVVTQTSNPAGGICRGVSDTLYIMVKPSPSATITIQGPGRFCVNSGPQPYTLPGAAGSTYVFQLNGTALANVGGTVTIPASTAVGTYTLTARETNTSGCAGTLITKTFTVDPRPGALVINGPRFVCPAALSLTYTVPNAPATSTYQWAVAGGTITAGQGTATITVSFLAGTTTNKTVTVTETSQFGCGGAAVVITVVPDNALAPQLTLASVVTTDNTKVTLTFAVVNPGTTPNPVRVLRRDAGSTGAFAQVGTVAATTTTYVDATGNAAQTAYEYSLALTNGCGDVLTAPTSTTTVLLKAVAVPGPGGRNQGSVSLSWSAYQGFAVAGYRLYRQDDNAGYNFVTTLAGNTLQYNATNTGQGFNQCFRVVAFSTEAMPRESNSNTACVDFANKTAFYNIITPNNDGQNDLLIIDNVQLYPGNSLMVFNRWGREVFATTNYNNTSNAWGSDPSVAAGVYYYLFKLADGTSTKGWVEVVK